MSKRRSRSTEFISRTVEPDVKHTDDSGLEEHIRRWERAWNRKTKRLSQLETKYSNLEQREARTRAESAWRYHRLKSMRMEIRFVKKQIEELEVKIISAKEKIGWIR